MNSEPKTQTVSVIVEDATEAIHTLESIQGTLCFTCCICEQPQEIVSNILPSGDKMCDACKATLREVILKQRNGLI